MNWQIEKEATGQVLKNKNVEFDGVFAWFKALLIELKFKTENSKD